MLSPLRPVLASALSLFWALSPLPASAGPAAGFSVASVEVVAERDVPQACFTFTQELEKTRRTTWERFVAVEPAVALDAVVRGRTLCLEGFAHGRSYRVRLSASLPGADGARLGAAASHAIEVPNRPPSLVFQDGGAMMSRIGAGGLPLRTINVERARLDVLRIADRTMAERLHVGRAAQSLIPEEADRMAAEAGEIVWQGEMAIGGEPNQAKVTAFPIDALLGTLGPGVYVARATVAGADPSAAGEVASRWFVVTELGLATLIARDGLVVFARTLADARPAPDVDLRLVARNGTEIATARTGSDGLARFPPDGLDGTGALAPLAVFATGPGGDFGVVELAGPDFDLVDRIGDGARPKALVHTDRGIYRPGETVRIGILLRDADGRAIADARPVLGLVRPDGFEVERVALEGGLAGGFAASLRLPEGAAAGEWTLAVHPDPAAAPVGTARLRVEDFVPPRIDLHVAATGAALAPGVGSSVSLYGRYAYGAPAAGLHGELSVTLRRAENAFPGHRDYRFGLAQETVEPVRVELPAFVSGVDGTARLEIPPQVLPETSHPLEAEIRAGLLDPGGGTAWATTMLPVHAAPVAIGIRPHFPGDAVPEGATAVFDVVTLDSTSTPGGAPVARTGLRYDLFEEVHEPVWFETDGRWDYRTRIEERRLNGGTLDVGAAAPARIELPVTAGRYRLEVFDPGSGAASSIRFSAGWWVGPVAGIRPDTVEVTAMQPHYAPGETARVFVRPPYAGQVLVTVTDGRIRHAATMEIGPEGEFLDIPLDPSWTAGVHVIATAFAPAGSRQRTAPRRASGRVWIGPEPWTRTLDVSIAGPTDAHPRAATVLPVTVRGLEAGENAYVTVTAVDETVLHLTRHRAPDPAGLLLDRRPLAIELRDGFGQLIEAPAEDEAGPAASPNGPPDLQRVAGVPAVGEPVVALFSGIVPVGEGGTVEVQVDIPDFAGVLRVTALAWSAGHMGMGGRLLAVGDPVSIEARAPRRLAPGDETMVEAAFDVQAASGDWRMTLSAEGVLALPDGPRTATFAGLEPGAQRRISARLVAREAGTGRLRVQAEGPGGVRLERSWAVAVERPDPPVLLRRAAGTVAPGAAPEPPADLGAGLDRSGLRYTLSLGALPRLAPPPPTSAGPDVAALEAAVGTARIAAAALPLASNPPDEVRPAIQTALDRLLAAQRPDGSFGAWTAADPADPWLTAHALDVLARARGAGLHVPGRAYGQGLERLAGMVEDAWLDEADPAAQAYALYVLARTQAVDPAEVRYFVETRLPHLPTVLARAQAAAALGLLGDADGARAAFARIMGEPLPDMGIRDRAGTLALLAESGLAECCGIADAVAALAAAVTGGPPPGPHATAWLRLADQALDRLGATVSLGVDGNPVTADRPLSITFDPAKPPSIVNTGPEPLHATFGAAGHPVPAGPDAPPVVRHILSTTGEPVDPTRLRPNQRVVVVIEGRVDPDAPHRLLAVDTPSAGLVVERTRLDPAAVAAPLSPVLHQEVRDNRFAAVIERPAGDGTFRVAYAARAGTPGDYLLPPPRIEAAEYPGTLVRGDAARIRVPALRVPVPGAQTSP